MRFHRFPTEAVIILALFTIALAARATNTTNESAVEFSSIPTPSTAFDIKRIDASDDHFYQIDFKVRVPFDDIQIAEFYTDWYVARGWNVCRPDDDWKEFLVRAKPAGKVIQGDDVANVKRYMRVLISKQLQRMFLVTLEYLDSYGHHEKADVELDKPVQNVRVDLYKPDLASFEELASLYCPKG